MDPLYEAYLDTAEPPSIPTGMTPHDWPLPEGVTGWSADGVLTVCLALPDGRMPKVACRMDD